jgi:hypothetical protein
MNERKLTGMQSNPTPQVDFEHVRFLAQAIIRQLARSRWLAELREQKRLQRRVPISVRKAAA